MKDQNKKKTKKKKDGGQGNSSRLMVFRDRRTKCNA